MPLRSLAAVCLVALALATLLAEVVGLLALAWWALR